MGRVQEIAARTNALVVSNEHVLQTLQETEPDFDMHLLGHTESMELGNGVTITAYEQQYDTEPVPVNTLFYVSSKRATILHLGHAKDLRGLADHSPNLLAVPINGMGAGVFTPQSAAEMTVFLAPDYVIPLLGDISKITEFVIAVGATKKKTKTLYPAEGESYTIPIYRR
jgi:hypothetical protein